MYQWTNSWMSFSSTGWSLYHWCVIPVIGNSPKRVALRFTALLYRWKTHSVEKVFRRISHILVCRVYKYLLWWRNQRSGRSVCNRISKYDGNQLWSWRNAEYMECASCVTAGKRLIQSAYDVVVPVARQVWYNCRNTTMVKVKVAL
jgi:hypothetical protein